MFGETNSLHNLCPGPGAAASDTDRAFPPCAPLPSPRLQEEQAELALQQGHWLASADGSGAAGCRLQLVAWPSAGPRKPCPSFILPSMCTNRELEKCHHLVHTSRVSAAWLWGGGWTWWLGEVSLSERPSHCMLLTCDRQGDSGCLPLHLVTLQGSGWHNGLERRRGMTVAPFPS